MSPNWEEVYHFYVLQAVCQPQRNLQSAVVDLEGTRGTIRGGYRISERGGGGPGNC